MQDLIDGYFQKHLSLPPAEAERLHQTYYKQYGLAIEGLVRHHEIDPLEYNRLVDDALPLEQVLQPDRQLRQLLEDIDRSKVRLWLFTNAYINHGRRVVRLLGVDDLFEGITYCDYGAERLVCKPHVEMFEKAQREAGVESAGDCYFVGRRPGRPSNITGPIADGAPSSDDSFMNCREAHKLGWTAAHLLEPDDPEPPERASDHQIRSLDELRTLLPQFFKA
ncbi:MAG: hypothetical protein M1832_001376 [Thelocarpon impressellum]|nr:MAG: hypothetical protein M1832_001376 [Thelocarpon impressellum]